MQIIRFLSPLSIPILLLVGYLHCGGWLFRSGVTLSCLLLTACVWFMRSRPRDMMFILLAFLFSIRSAIHSNHSSVVMVLIAEISSCVNPVHFSFSIEA